MNKTNKILIALLMLQATVLMGMRLKSSDSEQKRNERTKIFAGIDAESITALQIWGPPKKGDGPDQSTVGLEKKNGVWGLANADHYPANDESVKELVKKLVGLTSRTTVLTGSKYHDKLEVSPETYQRKLTVKFGSEERTFYFGTSPSFKAVHVRQDGQDDVLLVNDFGTNDLGERAWNWVERKYHDVPDDEVWQVTLQNAKGELRLDRDPTSRQWAALGVEGELDTSVINNIVSKSRSVNLEAPVGKGVKPAYGFDSPQATITLTVGTSTIAGTPPPTTKTVTFKVGAAAPGKKKEYFVKSSLSEYVARVGEWAVKPLVEKGREDLAKKPAPAPSP